MDFNLAVFQEPRGVMRILHFVFSICAFATITGFSGHYKCHCETLTDPGEYSYPFMFDNTCVLNDNKTNCEVNMSGDFSSDAKFFVATGVLAMLYSLAIMYVYARLDDRYKTNAKFPLYDFLITVVFGVLWLSSSAAWANGLTGLKTAISSPEFKEPDCTGCTVTTSGYSTLNISVIFGFLNFFLWAADLWFVYKETAWFPGNQPHTTDGV